MLSFEEIHDIATQVIENEAAAIKGLLPSIDGTFEKVVRLMLESKGTIVFSGIGKTAKKVKQLL